MNAYLPKGAKTYKLRIRLKDGRSATLSTGMQALEDYEDVRRVVQRWRGKKGQRFARPDVLEAVVTKRIPLYDAYMDELSGSLSTTMRALQAQAQVVDLAPLVTAWETQGAESRYVRQVRRLIVSGERFPVTDFERGRLADWLRTLEPEERVKKLTAETRRRYKTALSTFAEFLIERKLLTANPLLGLKLKTPPAERNRPLVFLSEAQVQTLVLALEEPYRSLEAMMAGTGMEWQAIARLKASDVNRETRIVFADGGKTKWRRRHVEHTEDWAWKIVEARLRTTLPNAKLWDVEEKEVLEQHHDAATELKLPRTILHQHRHAFAVMWIKRGACGGLREDGRDEQWLKNQLGHSPRSNQVRTTYGAYINEARLTEKATKPATSVRKSMKRRGVR